MKWLLEIYLRIPLLMDYLAGGIISVILFWLAIDGCIPMPSGEKTFSLLTDLANTSFTSTGFILTILTVLITFKANNVKKEKIKEYDSALSLFFETPLYPKTTWLLKNCIKSLLFVAIAGYVGKAFIPDGAYLLAFILLVFILIILALTLFRCILILGEILKLQNR